MKKLLSFLVVMAMTLSLFAPVPAQTAAAEGPTIEFVQWFGKEMPDGYLQSLADKFKEETGITVELLSNPYADTKTMLQASAAAGTLPDVVALDGPWIYDYATQGLLADLGAAFNSIGFDPADLSMQISVNGTVYAQPIVNFPNLMAVNMDLLKAAGINEPPKTWTELKEDCQKLTDPANNVYGFGMNMSTDNATCVENFTAFCWNSGGTILTEEGKPFIKDNELFKATCEMFKDLNDSGLCIPGMYTMTDADKVEEFVNGRIAFMPDSVAHLNDISQQAPDMNVVYINMPHKDDYDGQAYCRMNNWACGISAKSENPEAAAKWIAYLLDQQVNAELCVTAGGFVVNTKAEANYENSSDAFKTIEEVYKTTYGKSEFNSLPTAENLEKILDEALILYLDGDTTVDEMLADVQEQYDAAYK